MLIANLQDVKRRLGVTDSADDDAIMSAIMAVSSALEKFTSRSFGPDPASGTKTVYLDHSGSDDMHRFPRGIRSVTYLGVASTDQPDGTGTYTEIPSTGYYIDPPEHEREPGWPGTRITLSRSARFWPGHRTIKVTGAFGWATVPDDIREIAETLVVSAWKARGSGGTSTFTIGAEGERTYTRLLMTSNIPGLEGYRDVAVG